MPSGGRQFACQNWSQGWREDPNSPYEDQCYCDDWTVFVLNSASCKADLSCQKETKTLACRGRPRQPLLRRAHSLAQIEGLRLGDHQTCPMCQRSCSAPGPNSRGADAVFRCCMQYLPRFQHPRTAVQHSMHTHLQLHIQWHSLDSDLLLNHGPRISRFPRRTESRISGTIFLVIAGSFWVLAGFLLNSSSQYDMTPTRPLAQAASPCNKTWPVLLSCFG